MEMNYCSLESQRRVFHLIGRNSDILDEMQDDRETEFTEGDTTTVGLEWIGEIVTKKFQQRKD